MLIYLQYVLPIINTFKNKPNPPSPLNPFPSLLFQFIILWNGDIKNLEILCQNLVIFGVQSDGICIWLMATLVTCASLFFLPSRTFSFLRLFISLASVWFWYSFLYTIFCMLRCRSLLVIGFWCCNVWEWYIIRM